MTIEMLDGTTVEARSERTIMAIYRFWDARQAMEEELVGLPEGSRKGAVLARMVADYTARLGILFARAGY